MNAVFVTVSCPYCGESYDTAVDTGVTDDQRYVEDCAVCCRPITFVVSAGDDGEIAVRTLRDDDAG